MPPVETAGGRVRAVGFLNGGSTMKAKTSIGSQPPVDDPIHRYAHPYFDMPAAAASTAQPLERASLGSLGPVPATHGDGRFSLADIVGTNGAREIEELGEIRFHALGDSGVGHADQAQNVAEEMATDFKPGAGGLNPAFLFHLGDVVYGNDKAHHYGERFYTPYRRYPGKIIAIPGNHDGEVRAPADDPSLSAFLANFCPATTAVPEQAAASGTVRQPVRQPGVYWLLETPFLRVIGLYSNRLENPGSLLGRTTGGADDRSQIDWLDKTLASLAHAPKKGLVIASHHPPFSAGGHSGSSAMLATIDQVCRSVGVWPDLFLSGHAHNYQRYTRRTAGKQITYVVVGTGGMMPQPVPPATGQPVAATPGVTYDKAVSDLGYLFVTATAKRIDVEFWPHGDAHTEAFDTVRIDL